MLAKKVFHEDKELENERLELTDKGSLYFLGRNLTLRNCTLVLKVAARNLFIREARFIDCTFEVKQELKNHQDWIRAKSFAEGLPLQGPPVGVRFRALARIREW